MPKKFVDNIRKKNYIHWLNHRFIFVVLEENTSIIIYSFGIQAWCTSFIASQPRTVVVLNHFFGVN